MNQIQRPVRDLCIAIIGIFVTLYGVVLFNQHLLMGFPIGVRMVLLILLQWILFLAPGILMLLHQERFSDLGFMREHLGWQILVGLGIALIMSVLLSVLPILFGMRDWVGSTSYTQPWQFAYEFLYALLGIALAEELIFRGYIFRKFMQIRSNWLFAALGSSALFGLFHIFSGNVIQIFTTAIIGFIYCLCRERIRHCTVLSLIIAHGVYDALIVLWVGIL